MSMPLGKLPGLFQELFMSKSNLCNPVISSSHYFWYADLVKKLKLSLYPFTKLFQRYSIIQPIQTGYSLKHISFPQSGIVTKAVHYFWHARCLACPVHPQAQDVVCKFFDERQIVSGLSGWRPVFPECVVQYMMQPVLD